MLAFRDVASCSWAFCMFTRQKKFLPLVFIFSPLYSALCMLALYLAKMQKKFFAEDIQNTKKKITYIQNFTYKKFFGEDAKKNSSYCILFFPFVFWASSPCVHGGFCVLYLYFAHCVFPLCMLPLYFVCCPLYVGLLSYFCIFFPALLCVGLLSYFCIFFFCPFVWASVRCPAV